MKRIVEFCCTYLIVMLGYHGLHWLLVHYAGSVLPPAFSPALWTVDSIDAFFIVFFMSFRDYIHKVWEKPLEPPPPRPSATLPSCGVLPQRREGEE